MGLPWDEQNDDQSVEDHWKDHLIPLLQLVPGAMAQDIIDWTFQSRAVFQKFMDKSFSAKDSSQDCQEPQETQIGITADDRDIILYIAGC